MDNVTAVEVDGFTFSVSFGGFHETMEARTPAGAGVHFKPWTCRQHLTALERHLTPARGGMRLDAVAYAREVLRACGIPETLWNDLAPLALWWAAGGGAPATTGRG